MGANRPEKSRACWRASTEDKGFAERSTPTMTPTGRKNPEHVGVSRRRIKALRRGRRQHGSRQRHRVPELEVRDGFKIQIKILIALIDSYILLCIRHILYRFFFCRCCTVDYLHYIFYFSDSVTFTLFPLYKVRFISCNLEDSYTISALSFPAHPDKTQPITIIVIRKNKFAFFINSLDFR